MNLPTQSNKIDLDIKRTKIEPRTRRMKFPCLWRDPSTGKTVMVTGMDTLPDLVVMNGIDEEAELTHEATS